MEIVKSVIFVRKVRFLGGKVRFLGKSEIFREKGAFFGKRYILETKVTFLGEYVSYIFQEKFCELLLLGAFLMNNWHFFTFNL